MAIRVFNFCNINDLVFDDTKLVVQQSGVTLKRLDDQGRADPHGNYVAAATLKFPGLQGTGIIELFSFYDSEAGFGGSVTYHVSSDGGTTYYYWNDGTSAWVLVTDSDDETQYSTAIEIDTNLPTLAHTNQSNPQLCVRAYFKASDDLQSAPLLHFVAISYEVRYDFISDFKKSLKHFFEQNLSIYKIGAEQLTEEADFLDLTDYASRVTIKDVTSARNETTGTDIFDSWDATTNKVTFTATQSVDDTVTIGMEVIPDIILGANVDYEIAKSEAIVIEIPELAKHYGSPEGIQVNRSLGRSVARIRNLDSQYSITAYVRCISNLQHFANAVASAISMLFEAQGTFQSLAIDNQIIVLDSIPWNDTSDIKGRLWSLTGAFMFSANVPTVDYEEYALIKKISIISGDWYETMARTEFDYENEVVTDEEIYPH